MRTIRTLTFVLTAATLASCDTPPTDPETATSGPRFEIITDITTLLQDPTVKEAVTGHAAVTILAANARFKYSFTAIRRKGQTPPAAEGEYQIERTRLSDGSTIRTHGNITCFTIDYLTRRAFLGGRVERTTGPLPPGSAQFWTVQDNGEGTRQQPQPDHASLLGQGPAGAEVPHCVRGLVPLGTPIEEGNIQVHPAQASR